MKKLETLNKIASSLVVAVIRAKSANEATSIAKACIAGGIKAIEVTFTVQGASEVISGLKEEVKGLDVVIGAGTVLDSETARAAILSGADFIVSPAFSEETAKLCGRYQVPYLPGCFTITEIIRAMEEGADIVKLFPGSLAGPAYVKAIKGPLPEANIMPTGGVSLDNIGEWFKAGVIAVGIGGELTKPALTGDYLKVTELAKTFIQKALDAKDGK